MTLQGRGHPYFFSKTVCEQLDVPLSMCTQTLGNGRMDNARAVHDILRLSSEHGRAYLENRPQVIIGQRPYNDSCRNFAKAVSSQTAV